MQFNLPDGFELPSVLKGVNDAEDILMYYTKGPLKNGQATVVLVPIDVKKLIYLEDGNSQLLFNMLSHRRVVIGSETPDEVKAHFFSYEQLSKIQFSLSMNFESIRVDAS